MGRNEVTMCRYFVKCLLLVLALTLCAAAYDAMPGSHVSAAELQATYGGCDNCNCLSEDVCGGCNANSTCKGSSSGANCGEEGDDAWKCGEQSGEAPCEPKNPQCNNEDTTRCECNGETDAKCESTTNSGSCSVTGSKSDCTPHC